MATCTHIPLFTFEHTYAQLPDPLFEPEAPQAVRLPRMVIYNRALAEQTLKLPSVSDDELQGVAEMLSGNCPPAGAKPIAQAYAGHQFGHFTMLGDGRAVLLGEHVTPDGQRWDIQLKGSGQTAFSRRGDGRAALGPMLREYIISEAMHALGIPTTRSLAVVATGEPVYRDEPLPGAVLTRVAASHIRVGTFQFAVQDTGVLKALADHAIQRHYPHLLTETPETGGERYLALLSAVSEAQAQLIAQWMQVGFIHGVMNTDNMTISGETIDYGPCAFMDAYDARTVFSSIDKGGRYAYGNQPAIAQWNLARLAETLLPLINPQPEAAIQQATAVVEQFFDRFQYHWLQRMRGKLGLTGDPTDDETLIAELLTLMQASKADFTNTFRQLAEASLPDDFTLSGHTDFSDWHRAWQTRLAVQAEPWEVIRQRMNAFNPAVIPRNHQVEAALEAATKGNDLSVMHRLLSVLSHPYEAVQPGSESYTQPAPASEIPYQTFCGT